MRKILKYPNINTNRMLIIKILNGQKIKRDFNKRVPRYSIKINLKK